MPPILKLKKFFEILDTLDENTLKAFQTLNQKQKGQFFNLIKDKDKNKKILNIIDNSKMIKKTLFLKIIKELS
jgi:hypothetical protein